MEYTPKYPQPFTLTQAIALDPEVAWDEIARLRNSLIHLRRSQSELREYLQDPVTEKEDIQVSQALKENEATIASQDERILMLKLALTHHGHSVPSEQSSSESGTINSNSTRRTSAVDPENPEHQNGVYL